HDASISAVTITVTVGEHAEARISVWGEDFTRMVEAVAADVPPPLDPDCLAGKHRTCHGTAWDFEADTEVECACGCHAVINVVESL
ncbi:hypothetical protein, partial [Isoptericola hypogeus]|uniref:hypothetical protein n=1 Tax=Isoptericola hypogeus TaxID=300179 RepID=UPI0031DBFCD5